MKEGYTVCKNCGVKRNLSLAPDCSVCQWKKLISMTRKEIARQKGMICNRCGLLLNKRQTFCDNCRKIIFKNPKK